MLKKTVNRLSVLFLMILGVLPQIALVVQTMNCGVHGRLLLWILGAALCLWICACFRHGLLLGIPASAALLYFAARYYDANALTQLDDLIDRFSGAYYTGFLYKGSSYTYLNAVDDHSFVLLLIAFLLLAYMSSALTSSGGRRFMSLLGSVPVSAACLAVNGRPPYAPVVAMLLFWALVLAGGNYEQDGSSGKTVFVLTLPLLLLLAGLLWFTHPADYDYTQDKLVLSDEFAWIDSWMDRWLEEAESESGYGPPLTIEATPEDTEKEEGRLLWDSGSGVMDLTEHYDSALLETRFFSVRADESGMLYLRAVSYGDYLGTAWGSAEEAPCSSLAFTAQALQPLGRECSLTIRMAEELRYAIVPYYSLLSGSGDEGIPGEMQPDHPRFFRWSGPFDALKSDAPEEADYRSFAHEAYTRLPEETRSAMLALAQQAGLDPASPGIVDEVAAYIRGAGVYDIETPPYLSDDYAVCFLTQARRGYCVHFATAAVTMYRALGIPARITEGFLVQAERDRFVEVKGAQAHAWAEIYRDGLGWLPVEVTGRGGLQDPQPSEPEGSAASQTSEDPAMQTPVPGVETGEKDSVDSLPVGVVQSEPLHQPARENEAAQRLLRAVLVAALLLSALPAWRRIVRAFWRSRTEQTNASRAAVALWKRAQRLESFGGTVPAEIQNCAEKAYFSACGVKQEEVHACLAILEEQADLLYRALPVGKRFAFRYLYGFK